MIINCFKTALYGSIFRTISSVKDRTSCDSSKRLKVLTMFAKSTISNARQGPQSNSSILNRNCYPIFVVLIQAVNKVYSIKF